MAIVQPSSSTTHPPIVKSPALTVSNNTALPSTPESMPVTRSSSPTDISAATGPDAHESVELEAINAGATASSAKGVKQPTLTNGQLEATPENPKEVKEVKVAPKEPDLPPLPKTDAETDAELEAEAKAAAVKTLAEQKAAATAAKATRDAARKAAKIASDAMAAAKKEAADADRAEKRAAAKARGEGAGKAYDARGLEGKNGRMLTFGVSSASIKMRYNYGLGKTTVNAIIAAFNGTPATAQPSGDTGELSAAEMAARRSFRLHLRDLKAETVWEDWFVDFGENFLSCLDVHLSVFIPNKLESGRSIMNWRVWRYQFLHRNSKVSGLTAALLVMRIREHHEETLEIFNIAEAAIARDIRKGKLGSIIGTFTTKALLVSLFRKLQDNKSYVTDIDRLQAGCDLLVAYLCRQDRYAMNHRVGSPLNVLAKDLFTFVAEADEEGDDYLLHAVGSGLVYAALAGVATEVQTIIGTQDSLIQDGINAVSSIGSAAAGMADTSVFAGANVASTIVGQVTSIANTSATSWFNHRTKAIASVINDIIQKFNLEVLVNSSQGGIPGYPSGATLTPVQINNYQNVAKYVFQQVTRAQNITVTTVATPDLITGTMTGDAAAAGAAVASAVKAKADSTAAVGGATGSPS